MLKKWKILATEYLLHTPHARVRRERVDLGNGTQIEDYYVYEINEWAGVVPVAADGRVVMAEQYRHGLGDFSLEFPAGVLDAGESPLDCARRELAEETGYAGGEWVPLGSFHLGPAKISNRFHLYCVKGCGPAGGQRLDETEALCVRLLTADELRDGIENGRIADANSVLAWLLCEQKGLIG